LTATAWSRASARAGWVAGAAVAVSVAGALAPWRPATLCLLRATTGVPCPFCGSTTAAVRAAQGDLLGALAANPVTTLGVLALVLAPIFAARVPRSWLPPVFTAAVAVAWVWQLARFGLV
jgi:hypothetical protein